MSFVMSGTQSGGGGASNMLVTQPSNALNNPINMQQSSTAPNAFTSMGSGLNITHPAGSNTFSTVNQAQNMTGYNIQNQGTRINGRCTIRQLTTLIPEWKGHFDVANMLLSKQENALETVKVITENVVELNKNGKKIYEDIKNTLNGVTIQQEKLQQELLCRIKFQDEQNLISIKARRLSESIHDAEKSGKLTRTAFKIPNHLHVQLSKDLLDRVRNMKAEVRSLQNEVKALKNIDLTQATDVIESILKCHTARINHLGGLLSQTLVKTETTLKDGKAELWDTVSGSNKIRKAFLNAVGLVLTPNDYIDSTKEGDCESVEFVKMQSTHEITRQIDYLRRFNNAFKKFDVSGLDDTHYNIKDLLQQPSYTTGAFGSSSSVGRTHSTTGLFGNMGTNQSTIGQPSGGLFGSGTTGAGLFSSNRQTSATNLYGLNATGQTSSTTSATNSGLGFNLGSGPTSFNTGAGQTSSIFSQPTTTNIFGTGSQQSTANTPQGGQITSQAAPTTTFFGQNTANAPNTFGNIGSSAQNTVSNLAANTPLGSNTWGYSNTSAPGNVTLGSNAAAPGTSTFGSGGLFGGTSTSQPTAPTTTGAFNTRINPSGGLFGNTSTGFGGTTTGTSAGFGNVGFNSSAVTPQPGTTSSFVGSNLFEKQNAAKSTEIVLYQPPKN